MVNRNIQLLKIYLLSNTYLMKTLLYTNKYLFLLGLFGLLSSCKKDFSGDNYVAYFGGEVANPNNPYVLFCKNNKVIDTIPLKKDNTFFIKFDSLTPGLYSFKHEPEYQYIYFDKNDSLMVHVNSKDFDNSIVFCGRGDEKNNFLMEMYLRNEKDRDQMFDIFDYNYNQFNSNIEKTNKSNLKFYKAKKQEIQWDDAFDVFAKAMVEFPYYTKKEVYPVIHKIRTGEDVSKKMPKDYYSFRKDIDFSNETLTDFSPFAMYLNHMLNNVASVNNSNQLSEADLSLKMNINKLKVADTLIKNQKVKNIVLNNIAFQYLLEDQNMVNNQSFLETYRKFSTDKSKKNEILKIEKAIQQLTIGKTLPNVELIDLNGRKINSTDLIKKNTVFYFWSEKLNSHLVAAHKKVIEFEKKFPNYNFVAINLDSNVDTWKESLSNYKFDKNKEYHCSNFEDIRSKWAITKVHRVIIVNADKTIKNGFSNMFDVNFEDNLK